MLGSLKRVPDEFVKQIFLAAPFDSYTEKGGRRIREEKIEEIEGLLAHLRSRGFRVLSCHEREKWGEARYAPERCTPLDFEEIKKSDLLVAIPGNPPSGGVHVELGWASALQKPMIVLLKEGSNYSNLVHGLPTLTKALFIRYRQIEGIYSELDGKIKKILQ